jgi:hypothetical protein
MASDTLTRVRALVAEGKVRVSDHGYDELLDDDILVINVLDGVQSAILVEDYPEFGKGPSVLVLQQDAAGRPIHVVWGIPKGRTEPAVVVTAYRPDLSRWSSDFVKRKT